MRTRQISVNNYAKTLAAPVSSTNLYDIRVDQNLTDKYSMLVRWSSQDFEQPGSL